VVFSINVHIMYHLYFVIDQSYISSNILYKVLGESASFKCTGLYFIEWIVPWYVPKSNYTIANGTITINNITDTAFGKYLCKGYIRGEDTNNLLKKITAIGLLLEKCNASYVKINTH